MSKAEPTPSSLLTSLRQIKKDVTRLYYDGFVTNARRKPWRETYTADDFSAGKVDPYQPGDYEDPNRTRGYVYTGEHPLIGPTVEDPFYTDFLHDGSVNNRYSLGTFRLLPFELLGPIEIPPFPWLPPVCNISGINDHDANYLHELYSETHEIIKSKKLKFKTTKEGLDQVWNNWEKWYQNNFKIPFVEENEVDDVAVQEFLKYVLLRHPLPHYFLTCFHDVRLDTASSVLIVEFEFPDFKDEQFITGELKSSRRGRLRSARYKYASQTQSKKIIETSLYSLIIRAAYICSKYLSSDIFKSVVVNVRHSWFDPVTGQIRDGTIASVQGEKDFFSSLKPLTLDPHACFKSLKGISVKSLKDISPIRPIMELNFDDPRLVESKHLELDEGTNLAAMPWGDFEHLVAQLFELEFANSGIEVKVTRVSRDRGVDAILFDPDPLKGGKYILQAKRYTRTVDVAAVRDLFGTVHNEGANRGILITTSSYGPDTWEFAKDKPITLIDGPRLLSLFQKHQMKYRIDLEEARSLGIEDE